jgi:hypothetical protein
MNPKGIKRFKKLRAIFKSLKNGSSICKACAAASVDVSTLWQWRKDNEKLDVKIIAIIDSRIQVVEDALYKTACNGNTTAQIFFLTNRASERWADKRALVNNHVVNNITNNPYKNINEDDLKLIASDARISAIGSKG